MSLHCQFPKYLTLKQEPKFLVVSWVGVSLYKTIIVHILVIRKLYMKHLTCNFTRKTRSYWEILQSAVLNCVSVFSLCLWLILIKVLSENTCGAQESLGVLRMTILIHNGIIILLCNPNPWNIIEMNILWKSSK